MSNLIDYTQQVLDSDKPEHVKKALILRQDYFAHDRLLMQMRNDVYEAQRLAEVKDYSIIDRITAAINALGDAIDAIDQVINGSIKSYDDLLTSDDL
jgi:hypothetical protein